jgi:hypothetical protein
LDQTPDFGCCETIIGPRVDLNCSQQPHHKLSLATLHPNPEALSLTPEKLLNPRSFVRATLLQGLQQCFDSRCEQSVISNGSDGAGLLLGQRAGSARLQSGPVPRRGVRGYPANCRSILANCRPILANCRLIQHQLPPYPVD